MKINSKFTISLFKGCGLLIPYIIVYCDNDDNKKDDNDESKQKYSDMVFSNEDELKSYLQKQGIDIISNPSASVKLTMATLNFKIGKPFQLTDADIKDLKKSPKTYEAFNNNQEELNQMNFGNKNVSDGIVDDTTKLSELLKNAKSGEHIGMKINGVCFDLNIFNQLYCFLLLKMRMKSCLVSI